MSDPPHVPLTALDTLWFQVSGTLCNLACTHCLVSASPTNRTHEMLSLEQIRPYLSEAESLGVREFYFTGGEPFLNDEMESIIAETLRYGAVTVLTNGLTLDRARCARLAALAQAAQYSLDLRVSLDGYDAEGNDAIRGAGTFVRVLRGLRHALEAGLNPVITVTDACAEMRSPQGRANLLRALAAAGVTKPRLKLLPLFRIGAETARGGPYLGWQRLSAGDRTGGSWEHLQCSSCRVVTGRGVWVCPILVNEPSGRMGATLTDALESFPAGHAACWTCHVEGASCKT